MTEIVIYTAKDGHVVLDVSLAKLLQKMQQLKKNPSLINIFTGEFG